MLGNNYFTRVIKEIEKGQLKKHKKEKPRNYIGGSGLGHECERRIQYDLTHPTMKEIPEMRMVRIWGLGDKVEDYLETLMLDAGFDLRAIQTNDEGFPLLNEEGCQQQYGFEMGGGRVQGHLDGIIMGGPKIMDYPALFEAKSIKHANFKKFVDGGVAIANPTYYAQVQFYQKCMNLLNPALFLMMNKDNSEIYAELIPHHAAFADSLVAKAERILDSTDAGVLMPRGFANKTVRQCRYCDFQKECWKEPEANAPEWAG
jgi:hypothetical protein